MNQKRDMLPPNMLRWGECIEEDYQLGEFRAQCDLFYGYHDGRDANADWGVVIW